MHEQLEQQNNLSEDQQERLSAFLRTKTEDINNIVKAFLAGELKQSECSDEIFPIAQEFIDKGNTDIPIKQVVTYIEEIKDNIVNQL